MVDGGSLLEPYRLKYNQLELHEEIGQGNFGVVYRATLLGEECAVKTVRAGRVNTSSVESFRQEITVMAPLRHAFIVNMLGACWEDGPEKANEPMCA